MKKAHIRDYAMEAFRYYAVVGGVSGARRRWGYRAEDHAPELADLEAVDRALAAMGRRDPSAAAAVRIVYMSFPSAPVGRNTISSRIMWAAQHIPASPRYVYRALAEAREMFARERGLRI